MCYSTVVSIVSIQQSCEFFFVEVDFCGWWQELVGVVLGRVVKVHGVNYLLHSGFVYFGNFAVICFSRCWTATNTSALSIRMTLQTSMLGLVGVDSGSTTAVMSPRPGPSLLLSLSLSVASFLVDGPAELSLVPDDSAPWEGPQCTAGPCSPDQPWCASRNAVSAA